MENDILEQLYSRYYRQLFLYAVSLTGSKEDAEDLVANTFVKALTTFRSGNIAAWMYKVLRNEFFDLKKKRKWEISLEDNTPMQKDLSDQVVSRYIENEELSWLYRQILTLPQQEREVMLLTIQTDRTDAQMADILGISVSNIRVLRYRAKKRIIEKSKEEIL